MKYPSNKNVFKSLIPIGALFLSLSLVPESGATLAGKKIGLDPGHGAGINGGVVIAEGTWVLDAAFRARTHLQNDGATVVMTRTTGANPSLSTRYNILNSNNVNRAVIIHSNAASAAANGIETYYCSDNPSPSTSQALATDLRLRALSMVHNDNRGTSECLAAGRGFHFSMVKYTNMPSSLPEYYFHTNAWENQNIHNTTTGRENVGKSIYAAICDNYGQAPNYGGSSSGRPLVVRGTGWKLRNTLDAGGADTSFAYGLSTDIFVTGDWNGDGEMTPGAVREIAGELRWYLRNTNSAGSVDITFIYGLAGDIPVVGDWDGNGTMTPGAVRNVGGNATWYLSNGFSGVVNYSFTYGYATDIPIAGDWDGDGAFGPGAVRNVGGNSVWYLRNGFSGAVSSSFTYGYATDVPLPGDWDGNGTWTSGVVRGVTWKLSNNNATVHHDFDYGIPGDKFLGWAK